VHWSRLLELSALAQARLVARREVSSEELTRLYLARIDELNPLLQAFVRVWPAAALRSARRKDAQVRAGRTLPAFHGVPIGVKDMNLVRGRVTRFGSRAVAILAFRDCRTTASLRRAGFVLVGKTATSEFGAIPVTEPDLHPPTRNPWDPTRTAGGSSGGAACAVAAGLLPIAHGSDGGGSIRIPSALVHVFGMKPSRGRVPNAYRQEDRHVLYTCGAISRSVEDAAAMLDVLAGLDVGRPHWLAPPDRPFAISCREAPGPLRVGLVLEPTAGVPAHPTIREATLAVARLLETLGHRVEERRPPPISVDDFLPLWRWQMARVPVFRPGRLQPVTRELRAAGRRIPTEVALALQERMTRELDPLMHGVDLLLSPTVGVLTPAVGAWRGLPPAETFAAAAALGVFTAPANVTGAPAASVPAGLLDGRWPMGIQLVGRPGDDALVLSVSHVLEQAMPWAHLWPTLAGREPTFPLALQPGG